MSDIRSELAKVLHAATTARGRRVEVWREVYDPDDTPNGKLVARIYRGAYFESEPSPDDDQEAR